MRQWYVVYTKPRQEKYASQQLEQKGLSSFLPMLCEPWKRKRNRIEPLFPSYLFVHIRFPDEYYLAAWTPGTKKFVSFGEEPTPVADEMVEFLMERAGENGIIEARTSLRPGDEIIVSNGPFEGLSGIVDSPPDRQGRVRVLMDILREHVPVKLPSYCLKGNRPLEFAYPIQ